MLQQVRASNATTVMKRSETSHVPHPKPSARRAAITAEQLGFSINLSRYQCGNCHCSIVVDKRRVGFFPDFSRKRHYQWKLPAFVSTHSLSIENNVC